MKSFSLKMSVFVAMAFLCLSCGRKALPRLPTYEPPTAPSGLIAVQRYYPRQVVLAWNHDGPARSFVVERARGEEFVRIATVTVLSFTDRGLDEDSIYRYRVRALGRGGLMSEAAGTGDASPVTELAKPGDVSFDISGDTVKLRWAYPGDMSGMQFNIYRRTGDGEYPLTPVNGEPVTGNVFEDGQNTDEAVYYSVRRLVPGEVPTEGPPSDEVRVAPEEYVPSRVTGVEFAVTREKVLVFWDANPEPWVRGYRVYRAGEDGDFQAIGTTRTPAFEDGEPLSGSSSYRVSALGPVSEGPPSEIVLVQSAGQP